MTFRTSLRLSITTSALAAVLAIAPTASARPYSGSFLPSPSAPNVVDPHGTQARYNAQKVTPSAADVIAHRGTTPPAADAFAHRGPTSASVPSVPDRTDGLGSSRGPQLVQVPLATASDSGLSWSDALIGGAFLLGASLLAAFAVMSARGRGRGGLQMPS
jgi:hypothetical protein